MSSEKLKRENKSLKTGAYHPAIQIHVSFTVQAKIGYYYYVL